MAPNININYLQYLKHKITERSEQTSTILYRLKKKKFLVPIIKHSHQIRVNQSVYPHIYFHCQLVFPECIHHSDDMIKISKQNEGKKHTSLCVIQQIVDGGKKYNMIYPRFSYWFITYLKITHDITQITFDVISLI